MVIYFFQIKDKVLLNTVVIEDKITIPLGMPMPNRNVEGDYRYGFQGEFAEKETELEGVNSFQLRLYDSRIGRWISPDPYGEFHSPYLAMGNNPISKVDPNGGCTDCSENHPIADFIPDNGGARSYADPFWHLGGNLSEVVIESTSRVTINRQGFDINVSASLFTFMELANSTLSSGIDSYLYDIKYTDLLKTPKNHFAASFNGNTVYWKNNFRGNGSVSGSTVTNAKVDFTKNLRTGSNSTKVKGFTSALGYILTAGTVILDTRDYMNGSISGHRYSYHMGVSASATSFGYLFGAGPGALVGVAGMAAETGYDVFVDPRGPVWSNYGSWIPTNASSIMRGFGGR